MRMYSQYMASSIIFCSALSIVAMSCSVILKEKYQSESGVANELGYCVPERNFRWGKLTLEDGFSADVIDIWDRAEIRYSSRGIEPNLLLDVDGDGAVSREEFESENNPIWNTNDEFSIASIAEGFDCSYTAEVGIISDDELLDILIQSQSKKIVPPMKGIVLVQQPDHSFVMEEYSEYPAARNMTSIISHVTIIDLNRDFVRDIALTGLDSIIPGAKDQIIFGVESFGYGFYNVMPSKITVVSNEVADFFGVLSDQLYNQESRNDSTRNNGSRKEFQENFGNDIENLMEIFEEDVLYSSDRSRSVSRILQKYLGAVPFWFNLDTCASGVFPGSEDSSVHEGIVQDILDAMEFVKSKLKIDQSECYPM